MKNTEAKKVLETLSKHGAKGCGVLSLSNETGITASKLKVFFSSNPEFFCKINEASTDKLSKYTINRFSPFAGSVQLILDNLQQKIDTQTEKLILKKRATTMLACCFFFILSCLVVVAL